MIVGYWQIELLCCRTVSLFSFTFWAGDNLKTPWIGQTLHQRAISKLAKISVSQVTPAARKQGKVYANQCHQIQHRVKLSRCIWDHFFYHKDVHSFLIPFPVNQSRLSKLMPIPKTQNQPWLRWLHVPARLWWLRPGHGLLRKPGKSKFHRIRC